jgi:hypothetical protein
MRPVVKLLCLLQTICAAADTRHTAENTMSALNNNAWKQALYTIYAWCSTLCLNVVYFTCLLL